jgi:hypothetical protein
MDLNSVRVGRLYDGTGISAQEMSKANCGALLELAGEMNLVVSLGGKSTVNLSCAVTLSGDPPMLAFARVTQGSLLEAGSATYSGSLIGQKYICDSSEISGAASIPGTGQTAINNCLAR